MFGGHIALVISLMLLEWGMNKAVNLSKRVTTTHGSRFCPVVLAANGRIRPDYVLVDGKPEHHPEGAYYVSWYEGSKLKRKSAGRDAAAASAQKHRQQQILAARANGLTVVESGEKTEQGQTVEQAVQKWLAHRQQEGINNKKAKLMSDRLVAFCNENKILSLAAITRSHLNDFKLTLGYRTADSNSLRVHLSVLGGFFRWAVEEDGCLTANPFPRFKIKFRQPEITVPTTAEINRALAIEKTRAFASLMRYTGLAIQDAATLRCDALLGNLVTGNRCKTHKAFRVRIPKWLADELRSGSGAEYFFWDGKIQPESVAEFYRLALRETFKKAGVKMTPHGFRHYFVSTTLATGVSVEDVSTMIGSSPLEIRKTYRHWIKEATDRLDEVQQQAWIKQGLDADGNPKTAAVN
jgi:site-specific recombinase XerD